METTRVKHIKVPRKLWNNIRSNLLRDEIESFCYATGQRFSDTVVITDVITTPDEAYIERSGFSVSLSGEYRNQVHLQFAKSDGEVLINLHSHPFADLSVHYSSTDDSDDLIELNHVANELCKGKREYSKPDNTLGISMVIGQRGLDARILTEDGLGFEPIETVMVIDELLEIMIPCSSPVSLTDDTLFDRQIRAFGKPAQAKLGTLRVAICGLGGIGSIVAETVLRLGVKSLALIDHDVIERHNLNRLQNCGDEDVGKSKVEVIGGRLSQYFPNADIKTCPTKIYDDSALDILKTADVIIGCVDNHIARHFLNRLCVQHMVIYFDLAAQVLGTESVMPVYRLGVVIPGVTACLDCSDIAFFDKEEIVQGYLDPATEAEMRSRGYLSNAPEEPIAVVYPLNQLAAAMFGLEFLNLVSGYRSMARYLDNVAEYQLKPTEGELDPSYRMHVRADSESYPEKPSESCFICMEHLGKMDSAPLPFPASAGRGKRLNLPPVPAFIADVATPA